MHTARGVRTPPTVRVHSCTLPTVSLHLRTLTHGNRRRSDAMATLGDGVCTLTARPDGMPTRCDGLPAHRDGVCTQKCDNPRTSTCLYDTLKAAPT